MMVKLLPLVLSALLLPTCHCAAFAFASFHCRSTYTQPVWSRSFTNAPIQARPSSRKSWTPRERDAILRRNGEYFQLDRMRGKIEFGSSNRIKTNLDGSDEASVRRWLSNDEQIAMSIWDPKLIKVVEPRVYRLKLMTLMLVTIKLAPHVGMRAD